MPTSLLNQFGRGLARTFNGIKSRVERQYITYTIAPPVVPVGVYGAADPWKFRDQMLDGTVYRKTAAGGHATSILNLLGKPCTDAPPIITYYNPVPAIVGSYSAAFGGRFGQELKPVDADGEPLDKAVNDALSRIWRWSNLDTRLGEFTGLASNQGTTGIRIVSSGEGQDARIRLNFEHPSWIDDAGEDDRGNLDWIRLKYPVSVPDGSGGYNTVEMVDYIGRDGFSKILDGVQLLDDDQRKNALGICPYVIARHERRQGDFFGRHAYEGSELAIHGINWGLSQLDEATARVLSELIFMTGAGDEPVEVPLGRITAIYSKVAAGVPAGDVKNIVPQLLIGETGEYIARNVELLWTRQPQLILNALKLLSGTSGETLAQVLKPVEAEMLRARRMYESAMISALQIGLSAGIFSGAWNLGTGQGTKEAADRAYDDGQGVESFVFEDRPAIPPTAYQRVAEVNADTAQRTKDLADGAALAKLGDRQAGLELAVGVEAAALILQRERTTGVRVTEPL